MGNSFEVKPYGSDAYAEKGISQVEDASYVDGQKEAAMNKAAAVEAENVEHNMGVLDAVKAYPMAAFWAFVMSCTIVRRLSSPTLDDSR
jgi:SP family general alpha glucoside:H+ symporter-like MFS transporter